MIFLMQITVSIIILWISLWILVPFEMLLNHHVSWLAIKKSYIALAYMIKLPRWITCTGVRVRSDSVGIYFTGNGLVVWFAFDTNATRVHKILCRFCISSNTLDYWIIILSIS